MKRFITSLLALPLIVAFAVSCDRNEIEEEESVVIEGLAERLDFAAVPTRDVTFSITSNVSWSVSQKNLDWVSITPSSGQGTGKAVTVVISPEVNTKYEGREGSFTLTAGTVKRTVTVTQVAAEPDPVFNVDGVEGETLYLEALDVDGVTFNVSSNKDWTAEVNGLSWATVSPLSGEKDKSATITVVPKSPNYDETREGTISFAYGASAPKVVKVVHKVFEPQIEISVSKMAATTEGVIENPVVVVSSNAPWTATSSAAWLTVDKAEGTAGEIQVTVSAAANDSEAERTATVTFANRSLTAVLEVTQAYDVVKINYVDLVQTPVLFCSNNQAWNVANSPDYASSGKTGSEKEGGSGKGDGRLKSYSHVDNPDVFMQFVSPNAYGPFFLMAAEGNITAQNLWTDDAFTFHIPVSKIEAGQVLNIEYGLYGTKAAPAYWNSEVSFDGGNTWTTFTTGHEYTTPVAQASANSFAGTKDKSEVHVLGKCEVPVAVENAEIIVRVRCADGARGIGGTDRETPSASGTFRLIGGEGHDVENDANTEPVKGPKIYVTTGSAEFVPELSVSTSSISIEGTSASFDVVSNTDWIVTSSETWVTVTPEEGVGNKTVTVKMVQLEEGAANRTATINVSAKNYPECTASVTVEQIAPAPSGPIGSYVDLLATPVLFCSNSYSWNIANNPDYASAGMTGGGKVEGEGTGKGTGRLNSYSHLDNKDVYMLYDDSPVEFQTPEFIMASEGNITARKIWTDDAFTFYIPLWKATAGQTLCFDFQIYCKGSTTPKYWAVEVSLDGGLTYKMFDTGITGEASPNNGAAANFVIPSDESYSPVAAKYVFTENMENVDMRVRFRAVDGAYSIAASKPVKTSPGNGAVRIFGYDQTTLAGDSSVVSGPKIYIIKK